MNVMPISVSPRAIAWLGAAPDLRVLVDVLVELLQVVETLVLAHDLDHRREHRVRRPRGVRVRDLDLVLELGLQEVRPALRARAAPSSRAARGCSRTRARPRRRRPCGTSTARPAAPPTPAARRASATCTPGSAFPPRPADAGRRCRPTRRRLAVRGLRLDLGEFSPELFRVMLDLDPGGRSKRGHHGSAPFLLGRAVEHQLALGAGRPARTGPEPTRVRGMFRTRGRMPAVLLVEDARAGGRRGSPAKTRGPRYCHGIVTMGRARVKRGASIDEYGSGCQCPGGFGVGRLPLSGPPGRPGRPWRMDVATLDADAQALPTSAVRPAGLAQPGGAGRGPPGADARCSCLSSPTGLS